MKTFKEIKRLYDSGNSADALHELTRRAEERNGVLYLGVGNKASLVLPMLRDYQTSTYDRKVLIEFCVREGGTRCLEKWI